MQEKEFLAMTLAVPVGGTFYEFAASPELITAFKSRAIKVVCSEAQVLFKRGELGNSVYLVLEGEVGLILPLTSLDGMGFRAGVGSFVGLPAAFGNEPYSLSAIGQEGAVLAAMSREKFCDMLAASPALALDVLKILASETRAARMAIVGSGRVAGSL